MTEVSKSQKKARKSRGQDKRVKLPFDLEKYEAHKSAIAIMMGHFFLRHFNDLYHEFEGDLITPIVLGEIAHHNITRFFSKQGSCIEVQEHTSASPKRPQNLEPTNAFSISTATGIPRETVRRKIDKLVHKGWVVKNDRGEVYMSESVSEHFTKDFTKRTLADLLETSRCILELLERPATRKGHGATHE